MRAYGIKRKCDACKGAGRTFSIGHYSSPACTECHGLGYILYTDRPDKVDVLICSRIRPLSDLPDIENLLNEGEPMSNTADHIPLSDAEVAAIHLGRVRLANSAAIKQVVVDHVKGTKAYAPIDENDTNATMTCNAINVLDELLEPYGYRFGTKMGAELLG